MTVGRRWPSGAGLFPIQTSAGFKVTGSLTDTPGFVAGIRSGDINTSVNGTPEAMRLLGVRTLLRGKRRTMVEMTVQADNGAKKEVRFALRDYVGRDMPRTANFGTASLQLIQADITTLAVDAIVNAANASLAGGGGVDGAIHRAGGAVILQECRAIGRCATGSAVVTSAGALNARYVIHAVAPRYSGRQRDAELLASAYRSSLLIANERQVRTIAFPSLGTGAYGYPLTEASRIALSTVASHLHTGSSLENVIFALFSAGDLAAYEASLEDVIAQHH
jgi:O-acetyl-ADP-ribose deacetylase (regulator of RNase III)